MIAFYKKSTQIEIIDLCMYWSKFIVATYNMSHLLKQKSDGPCVSDWKPVHCVPVMKDLLKINCNGL
jgi:hypothetical protein